jgi:hypothetical protein
MRSLEPVGETAQPTEQIWASNPILDNSQLPSYIADGEIGRASKNEICEPWGLPMPDGDNLVWGLVVRPHDPAWAKVAKRLGKDG